MNLILPRVVASLRALATAGSHLETQVIREKDRCQQHLALRPSRIHLNSTSTLEQESSW